MTSKGEVMSHYVRQHWKNGSGVRVRVTSPVGGRWPEHKNYIKSWKKQLGGNNLLALDVLDPDLKVLASFF